MKYIDADKLIAEIDSRMEDCKLPDGKFPTTTNIVRYEELSCLRNFITSLRQEQPEVDLEKEIMRYQREDVDRDTTVRDVAQHFAEWGAIHLQPEVDLEKEIDAFFDKWDRNSNGCFFDENGAVVTIKTIKGVVKHFLNARKEE